MTRLTEQAATGAVSQASRWGRRALSSEYFVLLLAVVLVVAAAPVTEGLLSAPNLRNVLSNTWPLLIIAVGQTFVLIAAGIDLSQTAVMGLVSVVGAALVSEFVTSEQFGTTVLWGPVLGEDGGRLAGTTTGLLVAVGVMLVLGLLVGALNGCAVAYLRMPAFMVTLVTLTLVTSVAIWLTKGEKVGGLPAAYGTLGQQGVILELGPLVISWAMLVAVVVVVLAHTVLRSSVLGRWLYAVGTNSLTARISGVPVQRVVVAAYAFSGLCAAVGGLLYSARSFVGDPTLGRDGQVLLDIIGACVIGGTSLFGGRGKVLWTVFGVLFLVLLGNVLSLLGLPFYVVTVTKGLVILLAVLLDTYRSKWAAAADHTAPPMIAVPA
jgi:ribose transport system permease protein